VADPQPKISVLAGVNGAGKSSILGSFIEEHADATYVNPDTRTQVILTANPELGLDEANSRAWKEGLGLLEQAIRGRQSYTFETTLGGDTITQCLRRATEVMAVRIWYIGLASAEMHIARVRARVAKGGHDIPERKIRDRYERSRVNLIDLLPGLSALRVYDNSAEGDPDLGQRPKPRLLLDMRGGRIVSTADLDTAPEWVQPILAAALKCDRAA
jgi:predicted ABC-type ATPase